MEVFALILEGELDKMRIIGEIQGRPFAVLIASRLRVRAQGIAFVAEFGKQF